MKLIVKEEKELLTYLIENTDKSRKNLKVYLKYGNIRVNNKVVTKFDKSLKVTDIIEISESKNTNKELKILYEDKDIIVIDKPAGLLSISSETEKERTAYKLVMDYLKNINKNNKVFVVHRLDKETSGVLLFAKNQNAKDLLQTNWEKITVKKYIGVVEGRVLKETDKIKSLLNENKEYVVYSDSVGKEAITYYRRRKANDKYSLLEITIYTGRKNQIRVHMKEMGHPIIGDKKYDSSIDPIKRMGLHAFRLELMNPILNKKQIFLSDIPSSFNSLFR